MGSPTVLLVDDEENLRSMLEAALRHHGFDVIAVGSGRDALGVAAQRVPDIVVLDVMMPDLDGFEVCRRLRSDGVRVPIVFLTAKDGTGDRVRGLTIGGDDYLVKPFSLEELVARINAVLRRSRKSADAMSVLACADLVLDEDACRVARRGEPIALTPTEFNLLRFLLSNQARVMSKGQILDHVWPLDFDGDEGIVETYIGYLRRKIERPGEAKLIHTVRGFGYTLRHDEIR